MESRDRARTCTWSAGTLAPDPAHIHPQDIGRVPDRLPAHLLPRASERVEGLSHGVGRPIPRQKQTPCENIPSGMKSADLFTETLGGIRLANLLRKLTGGQELAIYRSLARELTRQVPSVMRHGGNIAHGSR